MPEPDDCTIDDALRRRWLHDPEFHAQVEVIVRRLDDSFPDYPSAHHLDVALLMARDLFPDAEWVERQARQVQALADLATGGATHPPDCGCWEPDDQ